MFGKVVFVFNLLQLFKVDSSIRCMDCVIYIAILVEYELSTSSTTAIIIIQVICKFHSHLQQTLLTVATSSK
jgi:hypothetical protein